LRYWDSSALVALHIEQKSTALVRSLYEQDAQVLTWILSDIEIRSALHRLSREGAMSDRTVREATQQVESLWESFHIISLIAPVKVRARRLLGLHSLRAADALQLGAALVAAHDDPNGQEFACLDDRLSTAAAREGFTVVP